MSGVDYQQAYEAVSARLSPDALKHSEGVAVTAAALALVYGVDQEQARLAGILHDWNKEQAGPELLACAQRDGVDVTAESEAVPYLLHAATGAREVEREFPGISEAVLHAISVHTVGSERMDDLDKVVWVADMLEPGRDFDGVDDLRECVGTLDLDGLFARAYEHSLRHLIDTRRRIHPDTVAVYNAHVAGGAR